MTNYKQFLVKKFVIEFLATTSYLDGVWEAVNVLRTVGNKFLPDNFLLRCIIGLQFANLNIGKNLEIELGAVIVELGLKRGKKVSFQAQN